MKRNILSFFSFLPLLYTAQGQLQPQFNNLPFRVSEYYLTPSSDTIFIHQFKFYLGDNSGNYHLVDLEDTATMRLPFSGEKLVVGMDSAANTSGKLDGAFDPLLGMYWAWNTGYIQLKVLGTWNGKPFEYHMGGYRSPYLTHAVLNSISEQLITIKLDQFFAVLPVSTQPKIMLPCKEAKTIFDAFVTGFQ